MYPRSIDGLYLLAEWLKQYANAEWSALLIRVRPSCRMMRGAACLGRRFNVSPQKMYTNSELGSFWMALVATVQCCLVHLLDFSSLFTTFRINLFVYQDVKPAKSTIWVGNCSSILRDKHVYVYLCRIFSELLPVNEESQWMIRWYIMRGCVIVSSKK
jgi:hypothetical protein